MQRYEKSEKSQQSMNTVFKFITPKETDISLND